MAIRPIFETPDPVLRQISRPVETFDDELKTLISDMFETMYHAPGIGLTAVQVGVPAGVRRVDVQVTLQNATGEHGIHIHEGGECGTDGKAAGPHWNPQGDKHGMIGSTPHHAGDLGNITDGALTMHVQEWTIGDGGPSDVVGHTLLIHAKKDDLKTDPAGDSGDRVACGVITLGGGVPTETPMGTEMTPGSESTGQPQ